MRKLLYFVGGIAILAGSFFGTLWIYDTFLQLPYPDNLRANDATAVKAAMERYRAAKGTYPPSYGGPLSGFTELVAGGFIKALPVDPVFSEPNSGYLLASNKSAYGLLVHLKYPTNSVCMTGVNFEGVGWFNNPPKCPF